MTKLQFLLALNNKLSGLPRDEVEERLNFYSEMIEDRIEEGLSEEEAVAAVGTVEEIAAQITSEIPLTRILKEKIKPKKKLKGWEITLLVVGSPLWLSLLITVFAVMFSVFVSLWAVFTSLVVSAFAVTVFGIVFCVGGNAYVGVAAIAAGLVCAGLSILLFFGSKATTKGMVWLTKKMILSVKKEAAV